MIYETAHDQRMRLNMQEQIRREAERSALLAPPPWAIPEVVPVIDTAPPDPDAPAPNSMPINEWMRHENERAAKREGARRRDEIGRDGRVSVSHRNGTKF